MLARSHYIALFAVFFVVLLVSCEGSPREATESREKARAEERQREQERRAQLLSQLKTSHSADETWKHRWRLSSDPMRAFRASACH